MKLKIFAAIIFSFVSFAGFAQALLKGTVSETGNNIKLQDVFVRNTTNKQITITDKTGSFSIPASAGNLLVFSSPGYVSDTLYVTDMKPKQVQLVIASIALREVNIRASSRFDPRNEYPEVYSRSKVYALSPTTWFGKEGRDARRLKHYFLREAQERSIDSAFNRAYVSSIVPLKGQQLEDFMTLYRPSYEFLRSNSGESMAGYVNDSYKRFMALPPEKRKIQRLNR